MSAKRNADNIKVAFFMDPIEDVNLETDTTFVLMLEAQRRGRSLFYFTPSETYMGAEGPAASLRPAKVRRPKSPGQTHFSLGPARETALLNMDLIFMRVDPPYNIEYVTQAQTLGMIAAPTVVVNRPRGVMLANEKLLAMLFPQLMPPTIITHDLSRLERFLDQAGGKIVVKPLLGFGGEGVMVVEKKHSNRRVILESMTKGGKVQVVAQKFMPVGRSGDKRIILLAGEPMGAVLRLPPSGDHRSNLHSGGKAVKTELTKNDLDICKAIGPFLKREGLYIAGIDVVAGKLTEINVTSPTLVRQINETQGLRIEERIMDFCEYLVLSARKMS